MSGAVALSGWIAAAAVAAWALALQRRLELVALADHELRGPVAALALAGEALRRRTGTRTTGLLVEGQVERLRIALADLAAARAGSRAVGAPVALRIEEAGRAVAAGFAALARDGGRRLRGDWSAASAAAARIDRGRFAQALGNVLANAVEHGGGDIAVATARAGSSVRVEVRDEGRGAGEAGAPRDGARSRRRHGRGNGLAIARRAVEEAGGSLTVATGEAGTTVTIELPLVEPDA